MANQHTIQDVATPIGEAIEFNWKRSPSIQKLLDVISLIIATEYVSTAKQNPAAFLSPNSVSLK